MDGFVVDSIQNSLTLDTHPNMRAMTHHAETPAELAGLFDVVAYDKGECHIRDKNAEFIFLKSEQVNGHKSLQPLVLSG